MNFDGGDQSACSLYTGVKQFGL